MSNGFALMPFLKWAGGKRWLVEKHFHFFDIPHDRYIEPFLGSGAVFFKLQPTNSIIGDLNPELIATYLAIKEDWEKVLDALKEHSVRHSKDYYYKIRECDFAPSHEKAARFIYLNRTCWNGLYRVNLKGKFNVPKGTKDKVILGSDDFEAVSNILKRSEIVCGDFSAIIDLAENGDLVFVDPPYTVQHNNNGFIKYNEGLFSWNDQIRLRDSVREAVNRGARVLVTNANHECIHELYHNMGRHYVLDRASVISGVNKGRGRYQEMVIACY